MMKILLILLMLTSMTACGLFSQRAEVTLSGNPPLFTLSGRGILGDFIIYGPRQRDVHSDRNFAVWEIEPIKGYLEGAYIADIGSIKYGIVPEGYKQVYPENNQTPPPLIEGVKYNYWLQLINAPHVRKSFEIRDNKAVETPDNN